jgi:hypothetical protein
MLHGLRRMYEQSDPKRSDYDPQWAGIERDNLTDEQHSQGLKQIESCYNKPDKMVTIYRALDRNKPQDIFAGDWVTTSLDLARSHGERRKKRGQFKNDDGSLGDYVIVSGQVPASHLSSVAWSQQGAGWKTNLYNKLRPGVIRAKHFDFLYNPPLTGKYV